jgi:hypothetical protein
MNIVPSGARKRMVAQTMTSDTNSFGAFETEIPDNMGTDNVSALEENVQPQTEQIQEPMGDDGKPDLTEYIFKTLEKFGYPPRRLEEFEKEFVNEKIFSGGVKEVTVTVPDRYYGTRKRISDDDFNQMINDIQNSFGLTFIDADRKDKKIIINFSSEKKEEESDVPLGDDLDDVYGPSKDRKGGTKRKATSMQSIKHAEDLYRVILERNPDLRRQITGEGE